MKKQIIIIAAFIAIQVQGQVCVPKPPSLEDFTISTKGYTVVFRDSTDVEVNFTYDGKVEIYGDTIQAIKMIQKYFLDACAERDRFQHLYFKEDQRVRKVIQNSVDLINKVVIYSRDEKLYKKYLKSLEAYGYYISKPKRKKHK